jgi:antitoxin YefM
MSKQSRNSAYLQKIDRSMQQLREGKVVVKTMEELEAMAQSPNF